MTSVCRIACLVALSAAVALAALGGDVSSPVSQSAFTCAAQQGWSFVIVRSYQSYGQPDPNAPGTLSAAQAAGLSADIYHFPCAMSDASAQISADISAVGAGSFNTMWLDIETNPSPGCGWSGSTSSNCNFVQQLIQAAQGQGVNVGIYTNNYLWTSIMGAGCTVGSGLPLWYAHPNGQQNFNDFVPFGGWSSPTMKQYSFTANLCGISADGDWYPGSGPNPPPPPPPPPPPGPGGSGSFTQIVCQDPQCSQGCQQNTLPTGQCLQLQGGGSAVVQCGFGTLTITSYQSGDCSGQGQSSSEPTNQCLQDQSGTYLENICGGGSSPGSGSGPAPPPPPPPPGGSGSFTQTVCQDPQCSQGCQQNTLPTGQCLQLQGGGSAVAQCGFFSLTITEYQSGDCSGQGQSSSEPLNQCLQDQSGTYLENTCNGLNAASAAKPAPLKLHKTARPTMRLSKRL